MKLTTKQIIITVVIVVVLFISIGIWFYVKGKKTTTIAPLTADVPTGQNNVYGVGAPVISQISADLYRDMNGFNWLGHDSTPYKQMAALSDTDFESVYNDFNTNHQSEGKGTFTTWINNEDYAFADVQNSIRQRLGRLNLP